jgi:penicillin V acylase-like amidase (Ntn superfamily)
MKNHVQIIIVGLALVLMHADAQSCTTFCLKTENHLLVGKNLGFYTGVGFISVNKRNLKKTSFPIPMQQSISWTARYGSITFNQVGKEFPYGGMNEKGLVVETMWLADAQYPPNDGRSGLYEMQWVQYQLDNAATVAEVIASDTLVRIGMPSAPIHFMIVDALGHTAVVEFLNGKMVAYSGSSLPVCALANDTYAKSNAFLGSLKNVEAHIGNATTRSLDRFVKASVMVKEFKDQPGVHYAFNILDGVKQGDFTKWSIVYDLRNMRVSFKTLTNADIRTVNLSQIDFACHARSGVLDVDAHFKDQSSAFSLYSYAINKQTIETAFDVLAGKPEFSDIIPTPEEREWLARYPETATCEKEPQVIKLDN